jgi:hypothetical protein
VTQEIKCNGHNGMCHGMPQVKGQVTYAKACWCYRRLEAGARQVMKYWVIPRGRGIDNGLDHVEERQKGNKSRDILRVTYRAR